MSMKHSVVVVALATAALATGACGQRSADTPSGSVGSAGQSAGQMQAQQPQSSEETQKQAANVDDTALNAKVKAAIMADPSLKGISVDTKNATVTLSGSVDSDMLRDRAKQIAMATEGVRNVVDNLSVRAS
jgi:hyperosmotically inducible periplasmic protein